MAHSSLEKLAEEFIMAYLSYIRHKASLLAKKDWGLFPFYWYKSSKITVFKTSSYDLAITIDRQTGGKEDKISIRKTNDRIEETQFPNLDYNSWPLFQIPENGHDIVIKGGTIDVATHPLIALSRGCDVRILQIRVEASVAMYPREKELLWFLTYPNEKYLSKSKAEHEAEVDFWGFLQSLVTSRLEYLLTRGIEEETLKMLQDSIQRLLTDYINLITRADLDEQSLQGFLESHYFLLSPARKVEKVKRKLGPYVPDFILQQENGTLTLVEIQLNRDPIIQNNEPSAGMEEAVQQLKSWFKWIDINEHSTLARYTGTIVIGRRESRLRNEQNIRDALSKIGYPVTLLTYDDLADSISHILSQLKQAKPSNH
jgi:hypothetical protein